MHSVPSSDKSLALLNFLKLSQCLLLLARHHLRDRGELRQLLRHVKLIFFLVRSHLRHHLDLLQRKVFRDAVRKRLLHDQAQVGQDQVGETSVGFRTPVDAVTVAAIRLHERIVVKVDDVEPVLGHLVRREKVRLQDVVARCQALEFQPGNLHGFRVKFLAEN